MEPTPARAESPILHNGDRVRIKEGVDVWPAFTGMEGWVQDVTDGAYLRVEFPDAPPDHNTGLFEEDELEIVR